MWREELKKIKQCPQRQDSTTDQMIDLHGVAVRLGFYDAADYIRKSFIDNRCSIGIKYENCSSKEYGQTCKTCINFR